MVIMKSKGPKTDPLGMPRLNKSEKDDAPTQLVVQPANCLLSKLNRERFSLSV